MPAHPVTHVHTGRTHSGSGSATHGKQHDGATDELIAATESALAKFPGALVSTDFVRLVGRVVVDRLWIAVQERSL